MAVAFKATAIFYNLTNGWINSKGCTTNDTC